MKDEKKIFVKDPQLLNQMPKKLVLGGPTKMAAKPKEFGKLEQASSSKKSLEKK